MAKLSLAEIRDKFEEKTAKWLYDISRGFEHEPVKGMVINLNSDIELIFEYIQSEICQNQLAARRIFWVQKCSGLEVKSNFGWVNWLRKCVKDLSSTKKPMVELPGD